jgi:hypothetical protein
MAQLDMVESLNSTLATEAAPLTVHANHHVFAEGNTDTLTRPEDDPEEDDDVDDPEVDDEVDPEAEVVDEGRGVGVTGATVLEGVEEE